MATWDDLEAKYGGGSGAAATPAADDPWGSLEKKYSSPEPAPAQPKIKGISQLPKNDPSLMDRVKAGAAGINKGFYSDLMGLPVDTVTNVLDLGKAAYGSAATTFGRPDLAPELSNRANTPGSSEWIAKKINDVGMGGAINNPNPDDSISRVAYGGGRAAGASVIPVRSVPISGQQQAINLAGGAASGLLASSAAEISDNPAAAGLAGMLPALAGRGAAGAIRKAVRGDEAGRLNMAQRIQDFKNGGVDSPSAGLASGNSTVQGVENLLALTPGSSGVFQRSRDAMLGGITNKSNQLRDSISPTYGALESGTAIQQDLKNGFKNRINKTQGLLSDGVSKAVGPDFYTPATNSIASASRLSAPIPGASATSTPLINSRISGIADNLKSDVTGTPVYPHPLMNAPPQYRRFDGLLSDTQPGIPFSALKALRTDIGQEASSNAIMGTPEQAKFKQLYGAMSQDMKEAVNGADRRNSGVTVGPLAPSQTPGAMALNRSNRFYSNAMNRVEALDPLLNKATPEQAYNSVASSLKDGPTAFDRVRNAVTPETRQKVAATIVDNLGTASPGQQGAAGTEWSPRTFLTNYNKMDQKGRESIFTRLTGGKQHAENLADIAKTADMIGQSSKVWSNPSGTAAALSARETIGGIAVGAFYSPVLAAGTAASLVGANAASRLLTNPVFVNWLAKAPKNSPGKMQVYAQRLSINAGLTKDAQFQRDVEDYMASIKQ